MKHPRTLALLLFGCSLFACDADRNDDSGDDVADTGESGDGGTGGPMQDALCLRPVGSMTTNVDPATSWRLGDLDADGRDDLVGALSLMASGAPQQQLSFFTASAGASAGATPWAAAGEYAFASDLSEPGSEVRLFDGNGDGRADAFVYDPATLWFVTGMTDQAVETRADGYPTTNTGLLTGFIDFDADGIIDLARGFSSSADGTRLETWRGLGDGNFELAGAISFSGPGWWFQQVRGGDDRSPHVLAVLDPVDCDQQCPGELGVAMVRVGQDGTPLILAARFFPDESQRWFSALADFDADGRPEIVMHDEAGYAILRREGGTLEPGERLDDGLGVAVADIDGDGHSDLAVQGLDGDVAIHRGSPDGLVTDGSDRIRWDRDIRILAETGDVDGDGRHDLVGSRLTADGNTELHVVGMGPC